MDGEMLKSEVETMTKILCHVKVGSNSDEHELSRVRSSHRHFARSTDTTLPRSNEDRSMECRYHTSTIVSSPPTSFPGSTTSPLPRPSSNSLLTSGPMLLWPLTNSRSSSASR